MTDTNVTVCMWLSDRLCKQRTCSKKWTVEWEAQTGKFDIHLLNLLWYSPGRAGVKGNDRADTLAGKNNRYKRLTSRWSGVLRSLTETPPADKRPWSEPNSKHWFTTSFLWRRVPESEARSVDLSFTPSITCKKGALKEKAPDDLQSLIGRESIFVS